MHRLVLAVIALVMAGSAGLAQSCDPAKLDLRDDNSQVQFAVEVMDDEIERAQGLMHREQLGKFAGMLFVYEEAGPVSFWMRNTLMPLDMLFFNDRGQLVRIHRNAIPLDETPIPGGNDIRYVLEINAGLAEELDVDLGAELLHPAIDQSTAAWPCSES